MSALGRVIERAAYPTAGAVGGAALGGPAGAAGGAAAGHFVGEAVTAESRSGGDSAGLVHEVFIQPTVEGFIWMRVFGVPMLVWLLTLAYILHRAPWIPGYLVDKFKAAKREDPHGPEEDPRTTR